MLFITTCLGILVTYAEPAISSLRPLARLVDPEVAPFLYVALNQQQEVLILSIALGVAVGMCVCAHVCDYVSAGVLMGVHQAIFAQLLQVYVWVCVHESLR